MRFVIIADIHLGPEGFWRGVIRRINVDVKKYLSDFIHKVNNDIKPEFVVVLGDLIQDENPENDQNNISYIIKSFHKINSPVHYVGGNHDIRNISESDLATYFGQKRLYYSFNHRNIHFVVLFSRTVNNGYATIDDEQIDWLERDLKETKYKTIIFVHGGLADQDLRGNPWFEGRPDYALIINRDVVRRVIEDSNKVIAVFNSHLHWDRSHNHNSIPYYTIQSFTENEDDKGVATEAYAIVDVDENVISVSVEGKYPKSL